MRSSEHLQLANIMSNTGESLGPHHPLLDPRFLDTSLVKDGHLDKSRLEQELSASFAVESKRKAEDDMKKRAIMTAKNYDEFAALVSVATLKPLKTKEIDMRCAVNANKALVAGSGMDLSSASIGGLNSVAHDIIGFGLLPSSSSFSSSSSMTTSSASVSRIAATATAAATFVSSKPINASDFEREWRKLSSSMSSLDKDEEKFAYLESIGAQQVGTCFRSGIDADILSSILTTISKAVISCDDVLDNARCEKVCLIGCEILLALSLTPGFSLNKSMMGSQAIKQGEIDSLVTKARSTNNEKIAEIAMKVYKAFTTN